MFQSTFPHGERLHYWRYKFVLPMFQSTFPHGERRMQGAKTHLWSKGFNPRSRTGNDCDAFSQVCDCECFNPRSRTGNDNTMPATPCYLSGFNPRSRTGNDYSETSFSGIIIQVSIHVPARGTTTRFIIHLLSFWFQSTFPHGERRNVLKDMEILGMFQSTFPHGERQTELRYFPDLKRVSIHVPARGTTITGGQNNEQNHVSIHVPARGTTKAEENRQQARKVSIHVPARGTTYSVIILDRQQEVSIHVPARGTTSACRGVCISHDNVSIHVPARGTTQGGWKSYLAGMFQSTFPHGERRKSMVDAASDFDVSIHVPARGTTLSRSLQQYRKKLFQSTFPHGERRRAA